MPEARLNLGQAVIALALAPKSNAVITAVDAALGRRQRQARSASVPAHLRDAHYAGAQEDRPRRGYLYAHDDPRGVAPQRHAPDAVADATTTADRPRRRGRVRRPAGADQGDPGGR